MPSAGTHNRVRIKRLVDGKRSAWCCRHRAGESDYDRPQLQWTEGQQSQVSFGQLEMQVPASPQADTQLYA